MRSSFFLASLLLAACAPAIQVGTPCEYNSDCPAGLACVNARCGEECREHRDCPLSSECLRIDGPGRCRLPEDTCEQCATGLVCGGDGLCHSPCGAQCPSDGECIEGACVRSSRDAGPPRDAMVDDGGFGAPTYEQHVPCTTSTPCPTDWQCVRSVATTTAVCRQPCTLDEECGNDRRCAWLRMGSSEGFCSIGCNPVTADGCPSGEGCDLLEAQGTDYPDGGARYERFLDCRRATASGIAGQPCAATSLEQCAAGHTCLDTACFAFCPANTGGGPNAFCAVGEMCNSFSMTPDVSGVPIGFCQPPP